MNATAFMQNVVALATILESAHNDKPGLVVTNYVKDAQAVGAGLRFLGHRPRVAIGSVPVFAETFEDVSVCIAARLKALAVPGYMRERGPVPVHVAGLAFGTIICDVLSLALNTKPLFNKLNLLAGLGPLNTAVVNAVLRGTRGTRIAHALRPLDAGHLARTMATAHVPNQKYVDAALFALKTSSTSSTKAVKSTAVSDTRASDIYRSFLQWQRETATMYGLDVSGDMQRIGAGVAVVASFKPSA